MGRQQTYRQKTSPLSVLIEPERMSDFKRAMRRQHIANLSEYARAAISNHAGRVRQIQPQPVGRDIGKQRNIYLTRPLFNRLRRLGEKNGLSLAEIIRRCMAEEAMTTEES